MSLVDLEFPIGAAALPSDVGRFLREAERRIEAFQQANLIPGFVPSDFRLTYAALSALSSANVARGSLFCEWGSGFGVTACLAAMLDFDAFGIEIESDLVDAGRQLAGAFDLPVEFVHGSFIPPGGAASLPDKQGFGWLHRDEGNAYEELGLELDDLDVIFSYPWPDEECVAEELFDRFAGVGALLMTYHGGEHFRVRRKTGRKRRDNSRSSARSPRR